MLLINEDKKKFKENGYLIKRKVIDPERVEAALDVIWENIEEDRNNPETWIGKGYRVAPVGGEEALKRIVYSDPVFTMAEELVGKGQLHPDGGAGPHLGFPNPAADWNPPRQGHLDGYHTPSNGVPKGTVSSFTLGATVYLDQVPSKGGGFTMWPGSHIVWAEYFQYHDIDSLPGGIAPFDLGEGLEFTGSSGDVCFWHHLMTHTAGSNVGQNIRMAAISRLRRKDLNDIKDEFPEDMWKYWEGIS